MNSQEEKEARLQRLLEKICVDTQAAHDLAKELYGASAQIFAQADGDLHAMDGDCDGSSIERQSHIRLSAKKHHRLGIGCW